MEQMCFYLPTNSLSVCFGLTVDDYFIIELFTTHKFTNY